MASGRGSLALYALLCLLTSHASAQSPVLVDNEQELKAALENDSSEIVIQTPFRMTDPVQILGESFISLIGECAVEGGACELTLDSPLTVDAAEAWMHNFVLQPGSSFEGDSMLIVTSEEAKVWMSSVTLQGNADTAVAALAASVNDGAAYFRDCSFENLVLAEGAQATAVQLFGAATATFEGCKFRDSTPDFLVAGSDQQATMPAVIHLGDSGTARLQRTSFNGSDCQAAPSSSGVVGAQSASSASLSPVDTPCIAGTGASSAVDTDMAPVDTDVQPPVADTPGSTDGQPSEPTSTPANPEVPLGGDSAASSTDGMSTTTTTGGGGTFVFAGGGASARRRLLENTALPVLDDGTTAESTDSWTPQLYTDEAIQAWVHEGEAGTWTVSGFWSDGEGRGLNGEEDDFLLAEEKQAERENQTAASAAGAQGGSSSSSVAADVNAEVPAGTLDADSAAASRSNNNRLAGLILGLIAAAVTICAAVVAAIIFFRRRQKRRKFAQARGIPTESSGATNVHELHAHSAFHGPSQMDAQSGPDGYRGLPSGAAGMHGVHAPKTVHPGQLVAPSKGGSYTHQYMGAGGQAYSTPHTGQWGAGGAMHHGAPNAGNLFVQTGLAGAHHGKGPQYAMHGAPPSGSTPTVPGLHQTTGPSPSVATLNAHNLSILEQAIARTAAPGPFAQPPPQRSKLSANQGLNDALDSLIISGRLLMSRYTLTASAARYSNERSVVQCGTDAVASGHTGASHSGELQVEAAVAVKFFLKRAEFDREDEVLRSGALSHLIDPAGAVRVLSNFDGALRAPNGYIYPPCVAMPCGRCLQQWISDPSLPFPDVSQMLMSVGKTVVAVHRAGWAHRNLHPGNILRNMTLRGHWITSDWNCAAKIGTAPQTTGRLMYAPPEDVAAVEQGQVATKATDATDVWALGMVAFESLTRTHVFPPGSTEKQIRDCLTGRHPLPWERMDAQSLACMDRLHAFKRSVMLCLDRNPLLRPRATQVVTMWQQLCFPDNHTSVDPSSHDVPVSSLEPRTALRSKGVPLAIGGYSAATVSHHEDSFFLTRPPQQAAVATGGAVDAGARSSTAPLRHKGSPAAQQYHVSRVSQPGSPGDQSPGVASAAQDAEMTVATAVLSAPTESAEQTEAGTTPPAAAVDAQDATAAHNNSGSPHNAGFYEPASTIEPTSAGGTVATGAEDIPPEALSYPPAQP